MSNIVLNAEVRADVGKGASRRLRRLEKNVPAIIYGGDKQPETICFAHKDIIKALEDERIYASLVDIRVKNRVEHVILKDLQRHPYKPVILHLDFQRVSAKDVLVKQIPVHFINEDKAPGIKASGIFNHTMTQIEVRCQVKDLPAFIEIDVSNMDLNDVIHLSDIKLPKDVQLTTDVTDPSHNFPVVSIHLPKVAQIEEPEEEIAEEESAESGEAAPAVEATEQKSEENKTE
jgi:large subunit ribosomal protein L25